MSANKSTPTTNEGKEQDRLPDVVVFVTNVSLGIIGGIIQYLDPLERRLKAHGMKVVTLRFPKSLNLMESRGLPRIVRALVHIGFALFCLGRILTLRNQGARILVHSHGASYALLTSMLAGRLGHPSVHTFHSPIQGKSRTLRWFAPKLDALVFVSASLHELIRTAAGVENRKVFYIPGSVDTQAFEPVSLEAKAILRRLFLGKYGLPDRGLLSIFVGRITPEKGVLELVEATGHLKALGTPTSVLVVGPVLDSSLAQAYHREIMRKIRGLGVAEWVALTGPVTHPEKERLMAASDIFVCSSLWEASGLSVVEAFAAGVPVVASRAGGLQERVQPGRNGLLVTPGDPGDLARAIDQLARNGEVRLAMGANARLDAVQQYSTEPFINAHLRLYAGLLASRGP